MRIGCLSLKTGDPARYSAATWHNPNVVRVGESDLRRAHCRRAQQTGLAILCLSVNRQLSEYETRGRDCSNYNQDSNANPRQGFMLDIYFLQIKNR